jgi:hypothetical protein
LIQIDTADKVFADLDSKVEAIEDRRQGDPLSPRVAVAMMKKFLAEE